MSHYAVLVIGDNPEDQLVKFNENTDDLPIQFSQSSQAESSWRRAISNNCEFQINTYTANSQGNPSVTGSTGNPIAEDRKSHRPHDADRSAVCGLAMAAAA